MSPLRLNGSTSGYAELAASAAAGDVVLTIPNAAGTLDRLNRAGNILQVVQTSYSSAASTSVIIPYDNTIPQNTEGTEVMTLAITPASASNLLIISVDVPMLASSGPDGLLIALFQDSTANALAVAAPSTSANNIPVISRLCHVMTAGTTSSTTFKVRYGSAGGTAYINSRASGSFFGGTLVSRMTITEIAA